MDTSIKKLIFDIKIKIVLEQFLLNICHFVFFNNRKDTYYYCHKCFEIFVPINHIHLTPFKP